MIKIGLIQSQTGLDPQKNAAWLAEEADQLALAGADIIFTPEMSGLLDRNGARLQASVQKEAADPCLQALAMVAKKRQVAINIGSLALRSDEPDQRLLNRSLVLAPDGTVVARYDKIHLFDVDLANGEKYRESNSFQSGSHLQLVDFPWGRLGLSICYDLRFPALHSALALAGAQLIAQPAAFTVPTGQAHWHVLLRARAIETGCFIVAAAQSGQHEDGRQTFGHSLVVAPSGEILLDMGTEIGHALVDISLADVADVRARIPNLQHIRPLSAPELATVKGSQ